MSKAHQQTMPSMLERYELKFMIPSVHLEAIADFVSTYCVLDSHSQTRPDKFYQVNNIYLDTRNSLFLRNRLASLDNRFNMRVRSYGAGAAPPFFLEVKQKRGQMIRKYRSKVASLERLRALDFGASEDESSKELQSRQLFERLLYSYEASPKILTQYQRMAWVGQINDYARVTFDRCLRFAVCDAFSFDTHKEQMASYDFETIFDSGCSVVLELKCYTSQVPLWMVDLIRTFSLRRTSFSKYANGVRALFLQRGGPCASGIVHAAMPGRS